MKTKSFAIALLTFALVLFWVTNNFAATITSTSSSGNWNSAATWTRVARTGTITTSTANKNVTGVGTAFTTELAVGSIITTTGGTVIGTVATISSDTAVVLVANGATSNSGISYNAQVVPLSSDAAVIAPNATVTVTTDATIASVTVNSTVSGSAAADTLTINSGVTLQVNGNFTENNASGNSGSATAVNVNGNLNITGTYTIGNSNSRNANLTIGSDGICTVSGTLTVSSSSNGKIAFNATTGAGNQLVIGGDFSNAGTFTASSGTVVFNATGAQAIAGVAYNNLVFSGSGAKSIPTGASIGGNLSIASGVTATVVNSTTISVSSLTLNGVTQTTGTWGGTGSGATNINTTYFNATTNGRLNVTSGATKLIYTTVPSTGTAGTAFSVTVQAQDAFGNPANLVSATTITLSLASGGGSLSGTLTGSIGVGANSVTISTPVYSKSDSMTLTATASGGVTLTAVTSGGISFSAGAIDHYVISAASPQNATVAFNLTITAQDAFNNTVTTDSSTQVTLTNSGSATFGSNPVTLSSGTVTVSVTDNTSDTISLTATDGNGKTGTLTGMVIGAAPAKGDYRSQTSGSWSTAATWQTNNGTTWFTATAAPSYTAGVITVRSGNTVTNTTATTVDQVIVQSGGQITVNGATLTVTNGAGTDLDIYGTVNVAANSLVESNSSTSVVIENGGTYTSSVAKTISASFTVNSGATMTTASGFGIVNNGTFNIAGGTVTVGAAGVGGSDLSGTGTLSQTGGLLKIGHDYHPTTPANFTHTGGTVEFLGASGVGAFGNLGTYTFFNVLIDSAGVAGFDTVANTIQVAGNWTNNSSTTAQLTGAVTIVNFNGTGVQYVAGSSTTTFNKVAINSGAQLNLASGVNFPVNSTLSIAGVTKSSGTWGSSSSAATHQNDTYFDATTGTLNVTTGVTTTTTLARHTGTVTPSTYGTSLSFDVTVTGASPSGTVTLKDGGAGGTTIGSATVSGNGTYTITPATTALAVGTHANIVAVYSGDDNNNASTSSTLSSQVINALAVTLSGTRAYDGTPEAASTDLTVANTVGADGVTLTGSGTLSAKDVGSQTIIAAGTPLRVQSASGAVGTSAASSFTVTVAAPQNGNTLVAVVSTRRTSASAVSNISQSGATWTRAVQTSGTAGTTIEIWYAPNVSSAGTTVTINLATSLLASAVVMEYQGVLTASPVDQSANNTGNSTAAVTGTTTTTTQGNELWVGGIGLVSSAFSIGIPNNSFTTIATVASTNATTGNNARVYALERIVTTTGTASSGGTVSSSSQWSGAIATFKAVSLGLSGAQAGNYTLTGLSGSMTITNKVLTVTGLTASNKTYDATNTASFSGTAAFLTAEAAGTGTTSDGAPYIGDSVPVGGTAVGTFADKNVGTNKTVTVSGITTINTNYTVTQPALSANITARGLTVTATGVNKVYDGMTNATVTLADNKLSGDVVTDSYASAGFTSSTAGNGKTINVSGISISGTDASNYTNNTTATTTANITQATPLVATAFSATAITFGQTLTSSTPTGALTNSLGATVTGAFTFANSGIAPNAGTTNVSVIFTPSDTTDYINVTNTVTVTVNKATPTATLAVNNSPVSYTGSGLAATVGISVSSVPGTVANILTGGAASQTNAGIYAVTANFVPTDSANYLTLSNLAAGNFVISKATPTATLAVNNSPVTYSGSSLAATVGISASSVPGTVANVLTGGAASQTNTGTYAVTANFVPTDAANYSTLTNLSAGNFVINQATPTATLAVNNSPATFTGSGLAATVGISVSSVPGTVANILTGGAASQTNAGIYAVTANFVPTDSTNYSTLTNLSAGNFVINQATPTATLAVNNSPATFTGSGLAATVGISVSSVPGTVANILTGGAASQTNAGTYAVTANFVPTDAANYSTLTNLSAGNFVINPANQTVTFVLGTSVTKNYNDAPFSDTATNSVGNPVTYSSDNTNVATVDGSGTVTITGAGTTTIRADTAATANYNAASQASQTLTVNGPIASQLGIATQPSTNATAGVAFATQPIIRIEDSFGTLISSDNTTVVTATRLAGNGTLQGTLTATAVGGVVTFTNLAHNVATNITIQFTASGLTSTNSAVITVAPATADHLVFATQPGAATVLSPFGTQPALKSQDAFGNDSTNGLPTNLDVDIALTAGTGPLLGTTNFDIGTAAGNGVVTFTNLEIDVAGTNKQLTASATSFTNAVSSVFSVAKLGQSITFNSLADKTYGDSTFGVSATASSGLAVSFSIASGPATILGTNVTITGTGTVTVRASQSGDSAYEGATAVDQSFNVAAKLITVTADAKTKVFGDSDPSFTYVSSDLGASFSGALSRASGETVGGYAITQGDLSAGTNYDITFVSADLTITPKPVTITADVQTKVFGDSDPAFTYIASDLGATFSGTLSRVTGETVGGYAITQGTLSAGTNYDITFVSANLTITAKPITVTADAKSKVYGDSDPSFTYVSSDLGATFSGALSRASGEDVGAYAITQGTLSAGTNYNISFVSADLTITAKPITVTADAKSKVYGDSDPSFTYVSSDLGATFSGALSRASGEDVGAYAITQGTLSAGTNYDITLVSADLTITPKPVTVALSDLSQVYDGTAKSVTATNDPEGLTVLLTYDGSPDAPTNTGTYLVVGAVTNANYTGSATNNLVITPKPITVTADAKSKVYGDSDPSFTYVASDLGATFSGTLSRASGETVGSYAITQGDLSAGTNYDITFVSADLTITPKPVTVTADVQSKVFGDSDPSFTYVSSDLGATFSGTLSRVSGETVGNYAITQGTLSAGTNYDITFVSADLTITAKPITVTANSGQSKVYGAADPVFAYTNSPLVGGDSLSGTLSRVAGETVGNYAITQGDLSAGTNYDITFVSADFTVTAKPITVTADAQTKVYGDSDPTFTYVASDLGATFSGALNRTSGEDVGAYAITLGTLSAGTNYDITLVSADLTITAVTLTVTADDTNAVYGDPIPTLTYTISGFVNGDTTNVVAGAADISTDATNYGNAGTYAIVVTNGTLSATNYSFVFTNGTLTVEKYTITVTADDQPRAYGTANPSFTLNYSGLVPGDDWGDVLSGYPTVSTPATAGSPIGTYPITPVNGSLSATNYQFEFVDGTLTVTNAPLSVTADTQTKVFGDSDPAFTYSITSGALYGGDSLSGALDRVAGEAVGAYAITQGTLTASTNYLLSFNSANLSITPASLTGAVTSSLNPAQPGSNVTFTATLTVVSPGAGIPSGTVQFKVDGAAYGSPATLTSGVATLDTTSLTHGSHTVTVEFATGGNFFGTTNALSPNQIINAAPTTTSDTLATHQDHAVNAAAFKLALNDNDPDGDALSVTGVSATSTQGGTVALASGTLTYTPPSGFSGADSFTYTVSDTFSATASGTVNVTVYSSTNQPERVVSLTTLGDNNKKITFAGIPSYSYVVQASTNLTSWITVSTNTAGTNGLFNYSDLTATNYANRYYRSVAP